MTGYTLAWIVIVLAAIGGAIGIWQLTRSMLWRGGRIALISLALVFFLTPAPIPGVEDGIAPAFVVAVFEYLFQNDGQPRTSLTLLGFGLGCVLLGTTFAYSRYRLQAKHSAVAHEDDRQEALGAGDAG